MARGSKSSTKGGGGKAETRLSETVLCPLVRTDRDNLVKGKEGHKITLVTNSFKVKLEDLSIKIYHYDVDIKKNFGPQKPISRSFRREIFQKFAQNVTANEGHIFGFDGEKNAYSIIPDLDNERAKFKKVYMEPEHDNSKEPQTKSEGKRKLGSRSLYLVTIKKVGECNLEELFCSYKKFMNTKICSTPVQMVNVLFHEIYANKYHPLSGSRFFSSEGIFEGVKSISGSKLCVPGFYASMIPSPSEKRELLMRINKAYTTCYKEADMISFLENTFGSRINLQRKLSEPQRKNLEKKIKTLKVQRQYGNIKRTKPVIGVTEKGASEETLQNDEETTVKDYFQNKFKIHLEYESLNCLIFGTKDRPQVIPMELCKMVGGQRVRGKLPADELKEFIKYSTKEPRELKDQLLKIRNHKDFDNSQLMKDLKLHILCQFYKFDGRILQPPTITMKQNKIKPFKGKFQVHDKELSQGVKLDSWVVTDFADTNDEEFKQFATKLTTQANEMGMEVCAPSVKKIRSEESVSSFFKRLKENFNPQLVLCVLPPKKDSIYDEIKRAGDFETEILTQCLKNFNIPKALKVKSIITNLIIQINAMLGGINWEVEFPQLPKDIAIFGADVSHPPRSPATEEMPSFAAVVGSYDDYGMKYALERRAQNRSVESIIDLKEMTKNLLRHFLSKKNRKPGRVVMIRDGLSDTEFQKIFPKEVLAMKEAFSELEKNSNDETDLKITYICVQKRHQVRFWREGESGCDPQNVPAGTVDDSAMTSSSLVDFYLVSHEGILGTSRPAHYVVLWDENKFSIDEMEQICYNLCYCHPNTSKSISIPAPVIYADIASYRGYSFGSKLIDESGKKKLSFGDFQKLARMTVQDNQLASLMHCL